MPESENDTVVDDQTAPGRSSPPVTSTRTVEVIVYLLLLGLALLGFVFYPVLGFGSDRYQAGTAEPIAPV